MDKKYCEWSNSQTCTMSNVGQVIDSLVKEKIVAIVEKLVQCVEPTISDEGGELLKL